MKNRIAIVLSIIFTFICAKMALAEIKEGLWEIKTSAEMKGMPAQMPPSTTRTCFNKNDMVPRPPSQGQGQAQECKIKEQKITGDAVTYVMACSDKTGMAAEITGKMTYKGDVMDGVSTMKITSPMSMEMSMKMAGKYIGPCTK